MQQLVTTGGTPWFSEFKRLGLLLLMFYVKSQPKKQLERLFSRLISMITYMTSYELQYQTRPYRMEMKKWILLNTRKISMPQNYNEEFHVFSSELKKKMSKDL